MRVRFWINLLLLAAIPLTGYSQSSSTSFSLADSAASSTITNGSGSIAVGYARILPNSGLSTPSGVAIFGYKPGSVLVTEAGVPASPLIKNGRIYAEVGPNGSTGLGTDIGMAIANPSSSAAVISFSYTRTDGTDAGSGTYTLAAGQQYASFLDQTPWNLPVNFQGTFTFTSNVPISVIALQLNNNARSEALITTLPVVDTTIAPGTTPAVLSHFVDGAGWSTSVLLVNPTDVAMSGNIQFRNQSGSSVTLTANGTTASTFNYSIPRRSSFKLQTAGAGNVQVGSVTVTPAAGTNTPVSLGVFSYANGATTITQAGVPSTLGTSFRTYVEATPNLGPQSIGSYSTGVAVANAASAAGTITFDLFNADGTATAFTKTLPINGFGQFSGFLSDIFPSLTLPFQGVLRVRTSTSAISVVALRIRYNERGEFLMTTTPPTEENGSATTTEYDFPHILNGGGFTTQFILFSGVKGQATSGTLQFLKSDSTPMSLTVNSTGTGAPVSLTSIAPTRAATGSSVTLTGSGFTSSSVVVFTTGSGTANATPSAQTATSLTVSVPANAITGPVFVQNGSSSSSPLILQVTTGGGTPIQTTVNISASATTTGADIYVPAPAGTLTFTAVGTTAGRIAYAASITVAKGSSTPVFAIGSGFSATSTVSVSGGGDVTVSNVTAVTSGQLNATLNVGATAASGPRNIMITNANGDTSILTGGLIIQ